MNEEAGDSARPQPLGEVLSEHQALVQAVGLNLPNGMLYQVIRELDGRRRLVFVSEAVHRFCGCSAQEVIADPERFYGRIAAEDRQRVYVEGEEAFKAFRSFSIEVRVRDLSGGYRWSSFASSPRWLPDGRTCWDGLEIDVTPHKQLQADLAREVAFRSMIIDRVADGFCVYSLDPHTSRPHFTVWNRRMEEITGLTMEAVNQAGNLDILWPDPDERVRLAQRWRTVLHGEGLVNEDWPLRAINGVDRIVSISTSVIRDAEDRPHVLTLLRDVTEQRQLEERLHQAEKMDAVGQLAGGLAHDFNNQIGGITGYADLLLTRLTDPDLRRYVNGILAASRRAADLTSKLMSFSRKGPVVSVLVNIHEVIREVVNLLTFTIDKRIEIHQRLASEACCTIGDPTQIQNALLNLGINARDAMPSGGHLEFSTTRVELPRSEDPVDLPRGPYIRIDVTDSGTGIDPKLLPHIFEPFFTTKDMGKGTGLGLTAVYGAMKAHHGAVRVESRLGRGSTFTMYLPLQTPESHPASNEFQPQQSVNCALILVVDDEEMVREAIADMLQDLGYAVIECRDGEEALETYRARWAEVQLVILDMVMPKMNGRDLFLAMRAVNPKVRAILSSGYSFDSEAQAGINSGMLAFLQKPFRQRDLATKVLEALRGEWGS